MIPSITRSHFLGQTSTPPAPHRQQRSLEDGMELVSLPPVAHLAPAGGVAWQADRGNAHLLQPLPSTPQGPHAHDSQRFRHRVGQVQIAQAHRFYRDSWTAQLLAARPSMHDDGISRRDARMAQNAGQALVRMQADGLVAMGLASNAQRATALLRALRKANILDGHYQVSRGPEHPVDDTELANAVRTLKLSNEDMLGLRDAVAVLKFLYDFGIREAGRLFDLELCCGANTFARASTWTEWRTNIGFLFGSDADESFKTQLNATRRVLSMDCTSSPYHQLRSEI